MGSIIQLLVEGLELEEVTVEEGIVAIAGDAKLLLLKLAKCASLSLINSNVVFGIGFCSKQLADDFIRLSKTGSGIEITGIGLTSASFSRDFSVSLSSTFIKLNNSSFWLGASTFLAGLATLLVAETE